MAIKIADSFSLDGSTKPNFARDQFSKLSDMKAYTVCDEGHIAYCLQDGKRYEFKNSNSIDEVTGKWREFKAGSDPTTSLDASAITFNISSTYNSGNIGYAVKQHINDKSNPHNVTAAQTGAYVKPTSGIPKTDLTQELKDIIDNVVTFDDLVPDEPISPEDPPIINYYTQTESDARYALKSDVNGFVVYEDDSGYTMEDEFINEFLTDGSSFAAVLSAIKTYIGNNTAKIEFDTNQDEVINQIIGI